MGRFIVAGAILALIGTAYWVYDGKADNAQLQDNRNGIDNSGGTSDQGIEVGNDGGDDLIEKIETGPSVGPHKIFPAINPDTGQRISVKDDPMRSGTGGIVFDIFIDNEKIGSFGAESIKDAGFSPENKYFAFRSSWSSGSASQAQSYRVVVIDMDSKTIRAIYPERAKSEYNDGVERPMNYFIESYSWHNDAVEMIVYDAAYIKERGAYFRVSPKEIWRYDLKSKEFTLLEVLPE